MKNILITFVFAISLILLYFIFPPKPTPELILSPSVPDSLLQNPSPLPTPTTIPTVSLGLMGDLGLGRFITATARAKNDFDWSFSGISPWLLTHDFNLANLESPIVDPCPTGKIDTFIFCGDKQFLPSLKNNKFVLSLANNHIFNYGYAGFEQTTTFLYQQGVGHFYSQGVEKYTKNPHRYGFGASFNDSYNDIKFGFFSFDFITNPLQDKQKIIDLIKSYDSEVDYLIVSIHWGNEYLPKPEQWRVDLARQMVDAGADIIHGHHPHVWQGYEVYKDKPIFYSFGNFIFDQNWSYETSHSQVATLTLSKNKIENIELLPITITKNSRPILTP